MGKVTGLIPSGEQVSRIAGLVAAGASVSAAIRAAGISGSCLARWQQLARRNGAPPAVLHLMAELDKARGIALAQAQVRSLRDKPADWLKTNRSSGKARRSMDQPGDELPWRGWRQWLDLVQALEAWPEARLAAARWVEGLDE